MDKLASMRMFLTIIRRGSFTLAAQDLDTTAARLSRVVATLERQLGTRLLARTTRNLKPTVKGELYAAKCQSILDAVGIAEKEALSISHTTSGLIRIHSMPGIGNFCVIDTLRQYRERTPDAHFEIELSNSIPDMVHDHFDLSIVLANDLPSSGNIAQRLAQTRYVLCASREYLATAAPLREPTDLAHHTFLSLHASTLDPSGDGGVERELSLRKHQARCALRVNNAAALKAGILKGLGIGMLPAYEIHQEIKDGRLLQVLPQWLDRPLNIYALYPSRRYLEHKTKHLIDHFRAQVPAAFERITAG